MNKTSFLLFFVFLASILPVPAQAQAVQAQITLLDRNGKPVTTLLDGNTVHIQLDLDQTAPAAREADFYLAGVEAPVGSCTIPGGEKSCQTEPFPALGWYWDAAGQAQPLRSLSAVLDDQNVAALELSIKPRPVVLVHGFNADWHTWDTYVGPDNFLAPYGLHGYAVGDGQVAGVLQTGSLGDPFGHTNTIAENAAILGEYIANVRQATGAEQVDLVVHSMGGMISRYYIDRVMKTRDVAQLIILGTPMGGSSCAVLPASLGVLLPATIEIQPAYMEGIFNQQIYHRRGVPFRALAGTKILEAVQSPCTPVPSDLVVTVDSVRAIPMPVQEMPLLHIDMNISPEAFEGFVLPHLQTPPGGFEEADDPAPGSTATSLSQFSKTFTGHLNPGESREVIIHIDAGVAVANFALYDTSRSLTTQVTGASGNVIQLDPEKNGLVQIDDPASLFFLGYGFNQPKPGRWIVTLQTTAQTPPEGADYAILAQFNGGASLGASISTLLPEQDQPVEVQVNLTQNGLALNLNSAEARLRQPDGSTLSLLPQTSGSQAGLSVTPDQVGLYSLEVSVTAQGADGLQIERAVTLAFEAQPNGSQIILRQAAFAAGVLVIVGLIIYMIIRRVKRVRQARAAI